MRRALLSLAAVLVAAACNRLGDPNERLLQACRDKDIKAAREALDAGGNPNAVEKNASRGFTALEEAIDSPEIAAMLLKAGALPLKPDRQGLLPASLAAA